MSILDGGAQNILRAIEQECHTHNLNIAGKLVAFGSGGAAVMIGSRGGHSSLLKQTAPWIVANYCVAYRLTLACAQAADEVPYIKCSKAIFGRLCYFYQYSAVHFSGLKEIQAVLNDPVLTLAQAVHNLRRCLPSLLYCNS